MLIFAILHLAFMINCRVITAGLGPLKPYRLSTTTSRAYRLVHVMGSL